MKLVLFGNREFASLAWALLTNDSPYEVVAFTVDRAFISEPELHGLPVFPFEDIERHVPAEAAHLLLPIGFHGRDGLLARKTVEARAKGYTLARWVSSRALVWPDLMVGEGSMVFDGVTIEPFARIGASVIVRSGCQIAHHVEIGDHSFLASHVVTGGGCRIGAHCFLGLGAVVRDGIEIADRCVIGAGAVVTRSTAPAGVYVGTPARRQASK